MYMAGLILKLRPHEELMINGVVVENGDRNTRLRVKTEGANILRLRDAMKPEEATTPEKQAYYIAQLAVAGQLPAEDAARSLRQAIDLLFSGERKSECEALLQAEDFYQLMRCLRGFAKDSAQQVATA